jgi:hypothetical protein
VDSRDYNWCLVMVLGSFISEIIDLPYLNPTSKPKYKDLYLLHLSKIFYNLVNSSIEKQSFVFTNHASVVRRFVHI